MASFREIRYCANGGRCYEGKSAVEDTCLRDRRGKDGGRAHSSGRDSLTPLRWALELGDLSAKELDSADSSVKN